MTQIMIVVGLGDSVEAWNGVKALTLEGRLSTPFDSLVIRT